MIQVTHSQTEENKGGFEATVLVGQASCLSFLDENTTGRMPVPPLVPEVRYRILEMKHYIITR